MFSSKEYDKIGSDWHDLGTALQNNPARDHELLFIDLVVKSDSVGWGPLQESKLRNYEGKELHSSVYVEEAYAQRKMAIRTKKYQYIKAPTEEDAICRLYNGIHGGVEELYDLESDPEQNHNLVEDRTEPAKGLKNLLSQWIAYLEQKKVMRIKAKVKDKISKLKHLGKL
jgi:hypothetical protein